MDVHTDHLLALYSGGGAEGEFQTLDGTSGISVGMMLWCVEVVLNSISEIGLVFRLL